RVERTVTAALVDETARAALRRGELESELAAPGFDAFGGARPVQTRRPAKRAPTSSTDRAAPPRRSEGRRGSRGGQEQERRQRRPATGGGRGPRGPVPPPPRRVWQSYGEMPSRYAVICRSTSARPARSRRPSRERGGNSKQPAGVASGLPRHSALARGVLLP